MICRILHLTTLLFFIYGKHVTHKKSLHYQAEENSTLTVEWQFSSKANVSVSSLKVHCVLIPELKVFFHLDRSVEESQHEQFAGRVHCDTDALISGLFRLHLFRVRTNDSGQYLCRMATKCGKQVAQFSLNITAAFDEPKPLTVKPQPASRKRVCFYIGLGLATAIATATAVLAARRCPLIYSALNTT